MSTKREYMRNRNSLSIRCVYILLSATVAAIAQNPQNPWPNDPQGFHYYPDDLIEFQYCAFLTSKNVVMPEPGVPFVLTSRVLPASGWHAHEVQLLGPPPRPQGNWLDGSTKITGPDGCAKSRFQFPGLAGWYTLEATPTNLIYKTKGINFYAKYYTGAGDNLAFYPDDSTVNVPAGFHIDDGHSDFSRNVTQTVANRIHNTSVNYLVRLNNAGLSLDRVDVFRCSIPDGGIADNEVYGVYPWTTRLWEEHSQGTECDLVNPAFQRSGQDATDHFNALFQAMNANGCVPGNNIPGSPNTVSGLDFWRGKNLMHVVCDSAPLRHPQ